MSKVIFDISMSLYGFITGANRTAKEPLGSGGEHLHDWAFNSKDPYNRSLISQSLSTIGAVICGRRTYDDSLPFWVQMAQPARLACRCSSCLIIYPKKFQKGVYILS